MKKRDVVVHVTDHAVLRWLEREHGIDVETVRDHLAGKVMTGAEYGAVAVRSGKVKLVLRDNGPVGSCAMEVAIVTAMPKTRVPHV